MGVSTSDLGATVCRALMRELDHQPIIMRTYNPAHPASDDQEWTTAGGRQIAGQWCAILSVQPDKVSVAAQLRYWGAGLYEYAHLNPGDKHFQDYLFISYPADPALIIQGGYEAELRTALEAALAAAAADWARTQAAHAASRQGDS
jgi:hypothetical protein